MIHNFDTRKSDRRLPLNDSWSDLWSDQHTVAGDTAFSFIFSGVCQWFDSSQTHSFFCLFSRSYTQVSRAGALHCLLTQARPSLMARKKQMSAPQPLVFFFAHYTCFHSEQQVTVHRLHDQQRNFFSYS